ncbi:MAG: hypothetical protein ACLTC4_06580 [Hungatella hathewayi]
MKVTTIRYRARGADFKYVVVGSPTLNNGSYRGFVLCYLSLSPKNRKAAFGSYGWGGQSISWWRKS